MKSKSILVALCLSIFTLAARADEAPASGPDLAAFKVQLANQASDFAQALLTMFDEDGSSASALSRVKESEAYSTCTKPGWFTSKEAQIRACLSVAKLTDLLAKDRQSRDLNRARRISTKQAAWKKFIDALEGLQPKERRELAVNVHELLVVPFNRYRNDADRIIREELQRTHDLCYYKELGESISCALDRGIDLLRHRGPELARAQRKAYARDIDAALALIDSYREGE